MDGWARGGKEGKAHLWRPTYLAELHHCFMHMQRGRGGGYIHMTSKQGDAGKQEAVERDQKWNNAEDVV